MQREQLKDGECTQGVKASREGAGGGWRSITSHHGSTDSRSRVHLTKEDTNGSEVARVLR
jgi:hypothetical protein